jgi:xylan 1,4-beta-xylosidase
MSARRLAAGALAVAATTVACAKDPHYTSGTGGTSVGGTGGSGAAGSGGGSGGATDLGACPDPAPWTPPAAPAACADAAPSASGAADVTLAVDAGASIGAWNRFYEMTVASDHARTLLCTAYGRNIQNALRKAHAQAGFQYVRFHGILNDDVAAYMEDASGAPIYDWSRVDAIYDAIVAAGMRPLVEISFTPKALASDPKNNLQQLWYQGKYPNISPPTGANGDWSKWTALMAEFVRHLEDRYGAEEVRDHWYFEVWNEPSWMYSLGDTGYFELYKNTVAGLVQADPGVRVGGPAGSSGESSSLIRSLITGAFNTGTKLDFLTYHRYGDDDGSPIADVTAAIAFHAGLLHDIGLTTVKNMKFTGEILNDEFGPSSMPSISRDTEVAASYIAKIIHLLGSDPATPAPTSYGYWAVSDLYEEINTGSATAFREGNYGLLVKGDKTIPESFDVAKPAFNAYRLLHMMSDQQLRVTGGTTADGVNAAATRSADGRTVEILVYNHVDGGQADSTTFSKVSLTVSNLPFSGPIRARQYIVDRAHANAYRAWQALSSPATPNEAQWVKVRDAAELCYYETISQPSGTAGAGGAWTLTFPQNVYGVDLIELSAAPAN